MCQIDYYPYRFVKKDVEAWQGPDDFLMHKLLYSFKSPKTNQTYWVWVEVYKEHFYAVKFHLKNHRNSDKKYNVMTGLNEARQCIKTCMKIMLDVASEDKCASFGFIGANTEYESEENTKRFRVYVRYTQSYFGSSQFEHYYYYQRSAYMLINKKQLEKTPNLVQKLVDGFVELYPYFD